jgi:hypothetical protein
LAEKLLHLEQAGLRLAVEQEALRKQVKEEVA